MAQVVWTPLAELELEDILFYIRIADGRPQTAQRIGTELCDCVDRQAERAESGLKHRNAPVDWLYLRYKRWLVFYRPITQGIEVMRVVDAVRDLPVLLP